jgi:hypothetical protein
VAAHRGGSVEETVMALPDAIDSGHSLVVETDDEKRVVWILGAGFSVPLGGPLFRELISEKTWRLLSFWDAFADHPIELDVSEDDCAPNLKRFGTVAAADIVLKAYNAGTSPKRQLWQDAEQFLDILEIAKTEGDPTSEFYRLVTQGGRPRSDIQRVLDLLQQVLLPPRESTAPPLSTHPDLQSAFTGARGLEQLHREAVRFVAAACTVFLRRFEDNPTLVEKAEMWAPYRRWAKKLEIGDSIITFNYDRTLNLLDEYLASLQPRRPRIVSPVRCGEDYMHIRETALPVFHLHGHVGWSLTTNGQIDRGPIDSATNIPREFATAHLQPEKAVLGIPGTLKTNLPTGHLKDLWTPAMGAIRNATAVVFVGYRFPETDNEAKERLADALRHSKAIVHIVLGARNDDTPRVEEMIAWTRDPEINRPRVHQMKSQDFFAVFERGGLLRSPR